MPQPLRQRRPGLVGCSDAIRALERKVNCAARSNAGVLITGETGVGKETVARLIHDRSPRASVAFVALACEGLPDVLVASELFGHKRGSFVGAYRDKPGLLEVSPNGSLFLDDVGELSPRMQAAVLRFLESGKIRRIGSNSAHATVNVRVMAAANGNLEAQIVAGRFREDLYSHLGGIRLTIPPLRERKEDIPPLVDHFVNSARRLYGAPACTLSPAALNALMAYRWPGNVRELQNVVERIVLSADGPTVQASEVPAEVLLPEADGGRMPCLIGTERIRRWSPRSELRSGARGGWRSNPGVSPPPQVGDRATRNCRRCGQAMRWMGREYRCSKGHVSPVCAICGSRNTAVLDGDDHRIRYICAGCGNDLVGPSDRP